MTVFELVEMLKEFNPDAEIYIQGENYQDEGLTSPSLVVNKVADEFVVIY